MKTNDHTNCTVGNNGMNSPSVCTDTHTIPTSIPNHLFTTQIHVFLAWYTEDTGMAHKKLKLIKSSSFILLSAAFYP